MSRTSSNLSDRIFCTINWTNGTAYIGELDTTRHVSQQKILIQLTKEELQTLTIFLKQLSDDILDVEEE